MFEAITYQRRRQALREHLGSGIVLLPGNEDSPINFAHNTYPFRQDATFSYFFGIDRPSLVGIIDLDSGTASIFADDISLDDAIWLGNDLSLSELCEAGSGVSLRPSVLAPRCLEVAWKHGRKVHFLPPYRGETALLLSRLTSIAPKLLASKASDKLIRAVVALREIKEPCEIEQITRAMRVADQMHRVAMATTRPGVLEREVVARMREVLGREGLQEAYQPIFSRRGEILHNLKHDSRLELGDLVVNDAGASSSMGYASDVTRTLPVGGRFLPRQAELYKLLVRVQESAIKSLYPGICYIDVHREASLQLVEGMTELGFFHGNPADVVESGAYALCFPHGLGHQLGLDVHDMESLGEDLVGYDEKVSRSQQFGLGNLRLGKSLKSGMVMTVEPGIYFIPDLIRRWQAEGRHTDFIQYERFLDYERFGGMRVEDVILLGDKSASILGPNIPKLLYEVEEAMS